MKECIERNENGKRMIGDEIMTRKNDRRQNSAKWWWKSGIEWNDDRKNDIGRNEDWKPMKPEKEVKSPTQKKEKR